MRFSPIESEELRNTVLNIFYHGSAEGEGMCGVGTHYDSIVCIRSCDFTLSSNPAATIVSLLYDTDFEIEYTFLFHETSSLWYSVGYQISGKVVDENTVHLLRCLVADECQSLSGIPEENLENFLFHLKLGRLDGGKNSLILLASLLNIKIRLHSADHVSESLAPVQGGIYVTIDLMERYNQSQPQYGSVLNINRRLITSTTEQLEQIEIAHNIVQKEIFAKPEIHVTPAVLVDNIGLRFATLHVNGCRSVEEQDAIDSLLLSKNVHLAALQEVNLKGIEVLTSNYKWYLGPHSRSKRRGLALLVRVDVDVMIKLQKYLGPNILMAEIFYRVYFRFATG